jgi:hypothetical protein
MQVSKDSVLPTSTPIEFLPVAEVTSKKCDFVPKKPLEEILSLLRDRSSITPDPVQPRLVMIKIKLKERGSKLHRMLMTWISKIRGVVGFCRG